MCSRMNLKGGVKPHASQISELSAFVWLRRERADGTVRLPVSVELLRYTLSEWQSPCERAGRLARML